MVNISSLVGRVMKKQRIPAEWKTVYEFSRRIENFSIGGLLRDQTHIMKYERGSLTRDNRAVQREFRERVWLIWFADWIHSNRFKTTEKRICRLMQHFASIYRLRLCPGGCQIPKTQMKGRPWRKIIVRAGIQHNAKWNNIKMHLKLAENIERCKEER